MAAFEGANRFAARAQIHDTYIIAQTQDGFVIVDQHAAHERLVYERLKAARAKSEAPRQLLLIPVIVEMDEPAVTRVLDAAPLLGELGLVVESFGPGAAEFLGDANFEAAGIFQGLLQDGRGSFPVMAVLTGDNQGLEFWRPGGSGAFKLASAASRIGCPETHSSAR